MDECIFCKIGAGIAPSTKLYEDSDHLGFLDLYPAAPGHCLLIPKKHYDYIWDIDNIDKFFFVAQKIAKHFQKVTNQPIVYSLIHGEGVKHAHLHIIPRTDPKTGVKISEAFKGVKMDDLTAHEVQEKFRIPVL